MRSLFWKIFVWFWGAMVLIGLALFLVVFTTQPDPLPKPWRETASAVLSSYATTAATEWERNGQEGLSTYLSTMGRRSDARFWFLDSSGQALHRPPMLGRQPLGGNASPEPPPGPPEELAGPPSERPSGVPGGPPPPQEDLGPGSGEPRRRPRWLIDLVQRAQHDDETIFHLDGPRLLVAQSVQTASGQRYVLAGVLPRPQFGRPPADLRTQWIGVLVVLGLSSLVCYGLVRYLTSPMVTLRTATRRLAAGDLSARTYATRYQRRDEVADLGRDFDTMAERIEALVRSQGQLLGDISHELRSPLSRLSMALALARRHASQGTASEELHTSLERIGRETTRLNALIGQLLELTRLESGETADDRAVVNLEQLIHEVVADADFEARSTERSVQVTCSGPCSITGTRSLLHSAIENVVRNAVRYTPTGTAVEVTLSCDNCSPNGSGNHNTTDAIIRVRDHGAGVPEAALSELFRPFYRVDDARARDSGGVGLGLAITERAIRSHGGSVSAINAPGGGLQIELRLPLNDPSGGVAVALL